MIKNIETPCFVLDYEDLQSSIIKFKDALNHFFPKNVLGYSVKTNSLPAMLKLLSDKDVYAEVVSHDEYMLALECGFKENKLVYNGPMKTKESFFEAFKYNNYVNIETKREIAWLKELPKRDKPYKVGIRINVNMNNINPEEAKEGELESRFGFSYELGELEQAIKQIKNTPNVIFSGIHLHRTTALRSLNFYKKLAEYAVKIIKDLDLKLSYIDIGGGYFGVFRNKPRYYDYMKEIHSVFNHTDVIDLNETTIIVEPGNAIAASCFKFYSSVIDVKKHKNVNIITTDGSRNDIDPFFKKKSYLYELLYANKTQKKSLVSKQLVTGCTCLEHDKIFVIENSQELVEGDIIQYNNVGAYTMCLTPNFIRFLPNVYLKKGNEYKKVRNKWSAKEYIINY